MSRLSKDQIQDLAAALGGIISKFYEDPKNEEAFQRWLKRQKESTDESS